MSSKILILNPDPSRLNKLLKKQNSLCATSGPFDAVFLLGDVLDIENVPADLIEVSVPTYFTTGATISAPEATISVASNIYYLGALGIFKLPNGLRVGYVTGDLKSITSQHISTVFSGDPVDILVTYHWPSVISAELKLSLFGAPQIDAIVRMCKPRYHFACGTPNGKYYERSPIYWKDSLRITRFISLGQYGTKERFHYAFNLNLESSKDLEDIPNEDNPFDKKSTPTAHNDTVMIPKRPAPNDETRLPEKPKRSKLVTADECFFCLSNPKIESHMVISIGDKCYLTVAKGPLTTPHKHSLQFSGHGIIIPIMHMQQLSAAKEIEGKELVQDTLLFLEIEKFKEAIVRMFQTIDPDLKVVFYEISRQKSVHYHIQFVPILAKYLDKKLESSIAKQLLHNEKFPRNFRFKFHRVDDAELLETQNTSEYILISVWNSSSSKAHHLSKIEDADDKSVDLQFPRRVLANVLNDHNRIYWDKCKQSPEKETEESERFKEALAPYDFTAEQ